MHLLQTVEARIQNSARTAGEMCTMPENVQVVGIKSAHHVHFVFILISTSYTFHCSVFYLLSIHSEKYHREIIYSLNKVAG